MPSVIGKSGYPCFEGRILEAQTHFDELESLTRPELEICLFRTGPNTTAIESFAQQWLYVLCRLAARCAPLPKKGKKLDEWDDSMTAGEIRFCPFAPPGSENLFPRETTLANVFFPIANAQPTSPLTNDDYRLFVVLDCKNKTYDYIFCVNDYCEKKCKRQIDSNQKNICRFECDRKCDGEHDDPFRATTIAILHNKYVALPTEDALELTIGNTSFEAYKPYLAWYLQDLFPSASGLIANLKEICGEKPATMPHAGKELRDIQNCFDVVPAPLTAMPHA